MVGSENSPTPTSRVDRGSGVSGLIASTHAKTGCGFTPSPRLSPNGSSDHTMLSCGPTDGHGTVCPAGDFVSTLHLTLGRPVTPVMIDDPPHILSIGPFSLGVIVHSSMTVRHFFGTLESLERMVASTVVPIPVSAPAALRDPRAAIICSR